MNQNGRRSTLIEEHKTFFIRALLKFRKRNKHVNGYLLKYSIVQNVFKCLIRLSPHDVSTSICKKKINQLVQRCIGFFFLLFLSVLGSFANNRHFYTFLAKIVFAIKRILPLTALQLTRCCFNVKWMVNGSVGV